MGNNDKLFPFLSVIIPTYRDWNDLKRCIEALSKQDYPKIYFEVLIVNNDPLSACPFRLPEANMRILETAHTGSYAARNMGVQSAKGDILVFTDADCVPNADWLFNGVNFFKNNKNIDRIAGSVVFFNMGPDTPEARYDQLFSFDQKLLVKKGTSVTANMWAKKRVFESVGLFDFTLKSGGDIQWGLKANAAGFAIALAKNVIVGHATRTDFDALLRKALRIYGGFFDIRRMGNRPLIIKLILSLTLLRPPVVALNRIVFCNTISNKMKISVVRVLLRLRFQMMIEHVRLSLGKGSERS